MKKFQFRVFAMITMALVCVGLISCGGDDESDTGEQTPKVEPIKESIKPFIGFWEIEHDGSNTQSNPHYEILFFQDMKCFLTGYYKSGGYDNLRSSYNGLAWDYDETNKILSVAGVASAQWQITSMFDNAWSGIGLGSFSTVSYAAKRIYTKKEDILEKYYYPIVKTWTCDTVKAEFYYENVAGEYRVTFNKYYTTLLDAGTREVVYSFTDYVSGKAYAPDIREIYYDEDEDKIVMNYIMDRKEYKHILLEFVHPYSYEDVYMNVLLEFQSPYKDKLDPVKWSGKFLPNRN